MRYRSIGPRRLLVAIAPFLASACDSTPTESTLVPNVIVFAGVDVVTTETAVLVDGEPLIRFGDGPWGFGVYHSTRYNYGGLYEPTNDAVVNESWFMDVGRRIVTDVRGDTVFSRTLDFGDVALEGTPARQVKIDTARVIDTGDSVHVYENILVNRVLIYSHQRNMDGSTVPILHEPFYEHMVAGGAIELTASGSDDIEPTAASIRVHRGARVTGLWNGENLEFERERPVLRTDRPLVVDVDRPLDPDRTLLSLVYFQPPPFNLDPEVVQRASAVFALTHWTDRVVIPASALAEVASHLPEPEGGLVFRISEYPVIEEVLEITRIKDGITEALSGFQSNGFSFYLWMRR